MQEWRFRLANGDRNIGSLYLPEGAEQALPVQVSSSATGGPATGSSIPSRRRCASSARTRVWRWSPSTSTAAGRPAAIGGISDGRWATNLTDVCAYAGAASRGRIPAASPRSGSARARRRCCAACSTTRSSRAASPSRPAWGTTYGWARGRRPSSSSTTWTCCSRGRDRPVRLPVPAGVLQGFHRRRANLPAPHHRPAGPLPAGRRGQRLPAGRCAPRVRDASLEGPAGVLPRDRRGESWARERRPRRRAGGPGLAAQKSQSSARRIPWRRAVACRTRRAGPRLPPEGLGGEGGPMVATYARALGDGGMHGQPAGACQPPMPKPRWLLALAGAPGSGKTTLAQALGRSCSSSTMGWPLARTPRLAAHPLAALPAV